MAELHALTVAEHIRVAEAFDTLKGELALICEITRQPLRELGAAIDAAIDPLRREYVDFLHCHDLHSIAAVYYARPDAAGAGHHKAAAADEAVGLTKTAAASTAARSSPPAEAGRRSALKNPAGRVQIDHQVSVLHLTRIIAVTAKKSIKEDRTKRPPCVRLNPELVPDALKALNQWVAFRWTWKKRKDGTGKWDKPPVGIKTFRGVSFKDSGEWATFGETIEAAKSPRLFSGFGVSLGEHGTNGLCAIDLDNCRDAETGEPAEWARQLLYRFKGTYKEVTSSLEGYRIWFKCNDLERLAKYDGVDLVDAEGRDLGEFFWNDRYFTVSSIRMGKAAQIAETTEDFWQFLDEHLKRSSTREKPAKEPGTKSSITGKGRDTADEEIDRRRVGAANYACLRVDHEPGGDGSGLVIRWAKVCVLNGCSGAEALAAIRMAEIVRPLPRHWTDAEILARYADARKTNELGEDEPANTIANFREITPPDKKTPVVVGLSQAEILEQIEAAGLRFISCNGTLYREAADDLREIPSRDALFAAMQADGRAVLWADRGRGLIGKGEILEAVRAGARQVERVERTAHLPSPAEGVHYVRRPEIRAAESGELARLLDLLSPATDLDRELLLAAAATVVWGGRCGHRPLFAITSAEEMHKQSGSGKSTIAEQMGCIPNLGRPGCYTVANGGDWGQMMKHLVTPRTDSLRVILLDNKRGVLADQNIEAMITAPTINGHVNYTGLGMIPNHFTWFATGNDMQFGYDMSKRTVGIQIRGATYSADWERRREAIDWGAVYSDLAHFFRRPQKELDEYSRRPTWDAEILSRCKEPDQLQRLIAERAEGLTGFDREAKEVRERVLKLLREHTRDDRNYGDLYVGGEYAAERDRVHIPAALMRSFFEDARGKFYTTTATTRRVKLLISSPHLHELRSDPDTARRGFVWEGPQTTRKAIDRNRFAGAVHDPITD